MRRTRSALLLSLGFLSWTNPSFADERGLEFFEAKIRPVLVERCNRCHSVGEKAPKGGLRLDSPAGLLKGGDSGPVIAPGKVDESLLIDAIAHEGGVAEMPPDSKLPDRVIADFRQWVEMGAPLPESSGADSTQLRSSIDLVKGRRFWSFLPALERSLPTVSDSRFSRNRIDPFILRGLDEHGMRPSPEADRRALIRRVTFDLTGLSPTPDEVETFVADGAPAAYERVVDRLLASPRHGERWGRFWLDVARYAEDNPTGEATNKAPRNPHAYRDWVIRALNDDLPFDEFVRRQLAADLMQGLPRSEMAALGFIGLAPVYHKEPKLSAEVIATIVADEWDERVDTITRGFLGLTVACARCHDHKFDPIGTADYYALAGVMASTQLVERPLVPVDPEAEEALAGLRGKIIDLELRLGYAKEMKTTAGKQKEDRSKYDRPIADLEARLKTLKAMKPFDGPTAPAVRDAGLWVDGKDPTWTVLDYRPGIAHDLPIFLRGNASNHGPIVPRRFPAVLSPGEPRGFREGSGRKELADGIVGEAASLTGRVSRQRVADVLRVFDFPDANRHGEGRDVTTTPLQQLYFLNSPFLLANSEKLAGRTFDRQLSPEKFVEALYRGILLREPTRSEIVRSLRLVESEGGPESRGPWAVLAQALLIGNEFLFVD